MSDREDFRVAGFTGRPQNSEVTCWAACAAMHQSTRKGQNLDEYQVTAPHDTFFEALNEPRVLKPVELNEFYLRKLNLKSHLIDVSSPRKLADFIKANAPIIVLNAIVHAAGNSTAHEGYHVRMIIGYRGHPDSASQDNFQVLVYDPLPPAGFGPETPFLFSHFKYQMNLKTGPVSSLVGQVWY